MSTAIQAHADRAHSELSPSGSERWLSCPGSVLLERQFPEDESSEYADEGECAHELSELHLSLWFGKISKKEHTKRLKEIKNNPFYSQEMEDYVQTFVDVAIERINAARARTPDATVLLEERLDYSPWAPEGFGTGDVVVIADSVLDVIDLKYGKGIPVFANENSQLRLYGLGGYNGFGFLYDIQKVRVTIVQPRLDSITFEEIAISDLLKWADEVVKPGTALALSGEGETVPGDHCQFCRARYTCKARKDANWAVLEYEFQEPKLLTNEELAEVRGKLDDLVSWASDVKEYMLSQAENNGVKFPGWKLVEGRSNRVYSDKEKIKKKLLDAGFASDVIHEPQEILAITKMEKAIGKKQFTELLSDLIVKPAGKPTLVEESDKRPELSSIASIESEFGDMVDE